jgi:hypothetical protein
MTIDDLPAITGAILVAAGIVQVFMQMVREPPRQSRGSTVTQSGDFGGRGLKVRSAYPGTIMMCLGALLLLASHFFSR